MKAGVPGVGLGTAANTALPDLPSELNFLLRWRLTANNSHWLFPSWVAKSLCLAMRVAKIF
jgi:hypothetical protein